MKHPPVVYRQLAAQIGEGRLADAILAKWLADTDADEQWLLLAEAICDARPGVPRSMGRKRTALREAA